MSSTEVAGEASLVLAVPNDAVPASQRGSWTSFLKSIASFSGDLSSLTAPPFILSPVSLTEFPAYWCEHPDIFAAIADAKDDESRALAVLRWFISTLKGQYTSRNESMGSEKKSVINFPPRNVPTHLTRNRPLNPVLGELFYGKWPATSTSSSSQGTTTLLVEQVSHHPPITAYVIENKTKGLRLIGHNAQKTSFSAGSIIVKQIGHAILTVSLPNNTKVEYLITLPRLRIDGLWYGSPYIELTDTSYIVGGGYVSTIEFKGKGYFSGKSHSFKAVVSPSSSASSSSSSASSTPSSYTSYFSSNNNNNSNSNSTPSNSTPTTHTIDGTWHTTSSYTSGKFRGRPFHDVSSDHHHHHHGKTGSKKVEVTAVGGGGGGDGDGGGEEMGEFETRRLWRDVARGIREGDFESASREKGRIENEQRQRRKDEQAAGTTWALKHFVRVESDPVYERLGKLIKIVPPTEDTYVFQDNSPVKP
ncbi:Protein KES1 [Hypsizygus marmoreus]|uniref:Protein KES1 n=1 Tax=Hypsizygus marmoreus TaxID=39966 RepID=A0A369JGY6_HYPMA|nr:Protein KES1 [Hypsizygus marmoreus]